MAEFRRTSRNGDISSWRTSLTLELLEICLHQSIKYYGFHFFFNILPVKIGIFHSLIAIS